LLKIRIELIYKFAKDIVNKKSVLIAVAPRARTLDFKL